MNNRVKIMCGIIVMMMIILVSTMSFAATASYYPNGNVSSITTDKGTIYYYENGNVDYISTPTGSAYYHEDGSIDYVSGTPSISLEQAKAELNNLQKPATATPTPTPTTTPTPADSTKMPVTGVEDYAFIPMILCIVLAIIFGVRYNSIKNI